MNNPILSTAKTRYLQARTAQWDAIADSRRNNFLNSYYHNRLRKVFSFLIPPGSRVLELGCGEGDLLAALHPSQGVGIDFSKKSLELGQKKHPQLRLIHSEVSDLGLVLKDEKFDFIILSDLINDLWDVQVVLESLFPYCEPNTHVIMNYYSRLWQIPLWIAQKIGFAKPVLLQNWLTTNDVKNLLNLSGFEAIKNWEEILFPLPIPLLDDFFNKFLVKTWPFNIFAMSNFLVARPSLIKAGEDHSVSVIVAARNEAGNIENIFKRTPELGSGTELVFVEGHSSDDTYHMIEAMMEKYPQQNVKLFRQDGIGKGDAVRKGFENASGEILMILDADLTVLPEDLPRFYNAIASNRGEFINGVRLVYPMEKEAMRFFNFLGNKAFSLMFSWLLGQPIKDTLCGTKVLWKRDYDVIKNNRAYFGDFDPFGDYDLLFGAARFGLKIMDMPVRYQERTYGTTNIQRWKHGWLLLKMVLFAASRIKFV